MEEQEPNRVSQPATDKLVAVPSRSNPRVAAGAPASKLQATRLVRSVVLGTLALGAGVWYLADMFSVDRSELLGYLGVSAMLIFGLMLLAAFAVVLLRLLKR